MEARPFSNLPALVRVEMNRKADVGGSYPLWLTSMGQLPQAGPDQPAQMQAVIEVAHHGRVRITYRLNRSPRRKVNLWFWTAFHAVAEPLQEDQPSDAPDPAHQQD